MKRVRPDVSFRDTSKRNIQTELDCSYQSTAAMVFSGGTRTPLFSSSGDSIPQEPLEDEPPIAIWKRKRRRKRDMCVSYTKLQTRRRTILPSTFTTLLLILATVTGSLVWHVDCLSFPPSSTKYTKIRQPSLLSSTILSVASSSPTPSAKHSERRYNKSNADPKSSSPRGPLPETAWQRAIRIETRTQLALEYLQQRSNSNSSSNSVSHASHGDSETLSQEPRITPSGTPTVIIRRGSRVSSASLASTNKPSSTVPATSSSKATSAMPPAVAFPDIRDCNSALATFGDEGDLLRALRLYFKMRKATQMALRSLESSEDDEHSYPPPLVPTPTLVTYSTLMSRAISLGKPRVALRLWKIMRDQADFFSYARFDGNGNCITSSSGGGASSVSDVAFKASELQDLIVPDVRSANILMNTYAKLGDIDAAEDLMRQMQNKPESYYRNFPGGRPSQERARMTSSQDVIFGGGIDVPHLKPNLVTFNTLLDACQKTGELEKALYWMKILENEHFENQKDRSHPMSNSLRPDARTFTSLIGTVAREPSRNEEGKTSSTTNSQSDSKTNTTMYGTQDPSLAFSLLEKMKLKYGRLPNPLTYSALIDVCGRCRRSDLALKALRLMIRDEQQLRERQRNMPERQTKQRRKFHDSRLFQQQSVGAWTSAINACGKTGRIDTAMKLFFVSMPRFQVKPNVITCSCLLDSLLKHGKTAESLEVLRYMKTHSLSPSEYMYTSLMTHASRLAGLEQRDTDGYNSYHKHQPTAASDDLMDDRISTKLPRPSLLDSQDAKDPTSSDTSNEISDDNKPKNTGGQDQTKAVDIYSELMSTLIATTKNSKRLSPQAEKGAATREISTAPLSNEDRAAMASNELYQVTMVFREMKASGVVPDLGSYNTLLLSCAKSGDIDRAQEILREILDEGNDLEPNDRTWRPMLRTAGKAKRPDIVLRTWNLAVADVGGARDAKDTIKRGQNSSLLSSSSTSPSPKKQKQQRSRKKLSLQTFQSFLTALMICAYDLRDSDRQASISLYKIVVKCYNTLRLSDANSSRIPDATTAETADPSKRPDSLYMGMHLMDSRAALDNPWFLVSILQAVVKLEYILDKEDNLKVNLRKLGQSIAMADCLTDNAHDASFSFFDQEALRTARRWHDTNKWRNNSRKYNRKYGNTHN